MTALTDTICLTIRLKLNNQIKSIHNAPQQSLQPTQSAAEAGDKIASIASTREVILATITVRNISDTTKQRLRQMAANKGHSMEEEVRRILKRATVQEEAKGLATQIHSYFANIEEPELPIPAREPMRPAPDFSRE